MLCVSSLDLLNLQSVVVFESLSSDCLYPNHNLEKAAAGKPFIFVFGTLVKCSTCDGTDDI